MMNLCSFGGLAGSQFTVVLAVLVCCCVGMCARAGERDAAYFDEQLPRGLVAVALGAPAAKPPTLKAGLSGWESAVRLDTFYRAFGSPDPVTPTEVRLLWDDTALYVYAHCANPGPLPLANQRHDDLHLFLNGAYPARERVAHFTAGLSSQPAGVWNVQGRDTDPITGFTVKVLRRRGAWLAQFTIPWALIGGKPAGPFGFLITRYHQLYGETSSPAAIDRAGNAEPLLYMEATLGGTAGVRTAASSYCTLPSGLHRWQPTARLTWPTPEERRLLWAMQQRLEAPTNAENLRERIYLAQRWYDVLRYEGVNKEAIYSGVWATQQREYPPADAVTAVNVALARNDLPAACQVVDALLKQFDRVSRAWFADESPGDIRTDAWSALERIDEVSREGQILRLRGRAGGHPVTLYLSCPVFGGVRLYTAETGFFPVTEVAPITTGSLTGATIHLSGPDVVVTIQRQPAWTISVAEATGRVRWRLRRDNLRFRFAPDGQVRAVDLQWSLAKEEAIYGFGEFFNAVNQRGNVITLWDNDAWEGNYDSCLLNLAYKPIPLLHSSEGYSLFASTSYRLRADVGNADARRCRLTASGPTCDFFLWTAPPLQAVQSYAALTGKPLLPPRWAFEPWMGGGGGRWGSGPLKNATSEILAVAKRFQELDIPHSAVYAEGEASADPRLYTEIAPYQLKVLTWGRSQGRGRRGSAVDENELPYVRQQDGSVYRYPRGHALAGHFPYIDFTNPLAMDLLRATWKRYLDLGVAGSMVDFGDLVPEDALFANGLTGEVMHNRYAYDYHRSFNQLYRERRGDDFTLFSRSAAPGDQAFLCQFAGDHQSNFFGMSAALRGGLNLAASGFPFWGSDIGGYAANPNEEEYLRWVEWGAFSPIMRAHGVDPREPWAFSEDAVRIYKHYAWVRESLLDYLYSTAVIAHQTGMPMMRPLPMAFPGIPALASCDDEYLLGPDLLVAPVHRTGESRAIILPPGRWTSLWDGKTMTGGRTVTVAAPLDVIPVFLRDGAVVPVCLNPSLLLGESLSKEKVSAIILTPPAEERTVHCWQTAGESREYTLTPLRNGMSITLSEAATQYLLLYGTDTSIEHVSVDGVDIPSLQGGHVSEALAGWYRDGALRTIIRLPHATGQAMTVTVTK